MTHSCCNSNWTYQVSSSEGSSSATVGQPSVELRATYAQALPEVNCIRTLTLTEHWRNPQTLFGSTIDVVFSTTCSWSPHHPAKDKISSGQELDVTDIMQWICHGLQANHNDLLLSLKYLEPLAGCFLAPLKSITTSLGNTQYALDMVLPP